LRALANEVYAKLKSEQNKKLYPDKNIYLAGGEIPLESVFTHFLSKDKAFLVCTMELLDEEFLIECAKQIREDESSKILFVIDEFHLFYYWGGEFRPILHDRFLALLNNLFPVLAITATVSDEVMNLLKKDLSYYQDFWIHLDFGNQKLHRDPKQIISYYGLKPHYIQKAFWREIRNKKSGDVFLYFCAYRSQVDELVHRSKRMGFRALGCVGGEVEIFLEQLKDSDRLDCIFSTTTLSHGVNLPEIKKVFPTAKVVGKTIIASKKAAKAYGGAIIPGPKLTEENADDFARRLISWTFATAPLFHRAAGGSVIDDPLDVLSKLRR
jgi:hypothetical protein